IRNVMLRGGRYFIPCFIDDTTVAVASLRGVDFFELSSQNPFPRQLMLQPANGSTLMPVRQVDTPGHAWSVAPVGSLVWVADGYDGVRAVDPTAVAIVAHFPDLANARSFHTLIDGGIVVCRHSGGADVMYTDDGRSLTRRIPLDVNVRVFSAASAGKRVFLGTLGGGYIAYTRNDTGGYTRDWTFSDCDRILWCHTDGTFHYLMDRDAGLRVLKSMNGTLPVQVGLCERPGEWRHGCMKDDHTILAAHADGLLEIDVHDPSAPVIEHELPSPLESRGIAFRNGQSVITDSEYGLRWIEWTGTPPTPETKAAYVHNGLAADVAVTGTEAIVAHTRNGLERYRITGESPALVEIWPHCDYATAVDIQPASYSPDASMVAVSDYKGAILLEAVPRKPFKTLSRIETPGRAVNVCLHDHLLLISDWFQGLQIMDISDPSQPVFLSRVETSGWVIDAAVRGSHAYVCAVNQGLLTVDISDPRQPVVTAVNAAVQAPEGIAVTDACLYLADFNFGLLMYDLADPAKPDPVSCYKLRVGKGVQIRDTTLILCNYIYGYKWFDITDPFTPVLIGEMDSPGKGYEAAFLPDRNAMLAADWHALLEVTW
ncbi:MAG TPA: hypothetical protein PLV45_12165, partial [bacterium]|nr:hypothetical protein [bacterium]